MLHIFVTIPAGAAKLGTVGMSASSSIKVCTSKHEVLINAYIQNLTYPKKSDEAKPPKKVFLYTWRKVSFPARKIPGGI